MSNAKFQGSKGPWRFEGRTGRLLDSNGDVICGFWAESDFSGCTDAIHGTLCASAPKMLEILQEIIEGNNKFRIGKEMKAKATEVIGQALNWEGDESWMDKEETD
ncbi:hypothetical protein M2407_001056 [Serratia sp. BIGb0234]|uniref:hypothetical protein n=1 Tax=Serratia sp. BIGb0234 TaxID=2940614 RepID=UPI0021698F49|nr:hypothetical protein [Serratia sp. BIGb0234]MCS4316757.1 hypothetical protein [Serratia sp. BIGb0234]